MTKEQIITAIEQAVSSGEIKDVDTGFVTTLKEQNKNTGLKFWVGTSAEYNAIAEKEQNCFYILTDDTTGADIKKMLEEHEASIEEHEASIARHEARLEELEQENEFVEYIAGETVFESDVTYEFMISCFAEGWTTSEIVFLQGANADIEYKKVVGGSVYDFDGYARPAYELYIFVMSIRNLTDIVFEKYMQDSGAPVEEGWIAQRVTSSFAVRYRKLK
jgi:hypothetical protein